VKVAVVGLGQQGFVLCLLSYFADCARRKKFSIRQRAVLDARLENT
jgi:hypothetical protein